MAKALTRELSNIFRAIRIHSTTSLTFAGQSLSPANTATLPAQAGGQPQEWLVSQLQQQLYQHCFCQRFHGHLAPPPPAVAEGNELIEALSRANASRDRWDPGWYISQMLPSGQIVAQKYGQTRWLWPGEFVTQFGPGVAPQVGSPISVYFPRESKTMQPGFYFAFGETPDGADGTYNVIRFYWNVKESGLTDLVHDLTRTLNRFYVPFRFKCVSYRTLASRIDSAVLYVAKRYYRIVAEALVDVHRRLKTNLATHTPLFTKELGPGLAFAEDPGNGESFGMSRCRIVSEAVWNAYARGEQSEQGRLREVAHQFERYGIPWDRPYLSPGSADQYEFPSFQA